MSLESTASIYIAGTASIFIAGGMSILGQLRIVLSKTTMMCQEKNTSNSTEEASKVEATTSTCGPQVEDVAKHIKDRHPPPPPPLSNIHAQLHINGRINQGPNAP